MGTRVKPVLRYCFIFLIFCSSFCSCVKANNENKEVGTNITSANENNDVGANSTPANENRKSTYIEVKSDYSIELFNNKITGTVWFGEIMVQDDVSKEQKLKNITLTFLDDSNAQVLEWEEFILGRDGNQYNYKEVDDGIVLSIKIYELNYDNGFNEDYYMEDSQEVLREYPAIISEDTMTFHEWMNGESLVLVRRNDLGSNEDAIVIVDTYYEDSQYFIILECKLLSFYRSDYHFWVSPDEHGDGSSAGINRNIGYVVFDRGFNRMIGAFPEDEIKQIEEACLKKLIFEYVGTGGFTEEDRERYLANNTPPRISYIWASFGHVNNYFIAKTKGQTKFR